MVKFGVAVAVVVKLISPTGGIEAGTLHNVLTARIKLFGRRILAVRALGVDCIRKVGFGNGSGGGIYEALFVNVDVVELKGNGADRLFSLFCGLEAAPNHIHKGHRLGLRTQEAGELTFMVHGNDTLIGGGGNDVDVTGSTDSHSDRLIDVVIREKLRFSVLQ